MLGIFLAMLFCAAIPLAIGVTIIRGLCHDWRELTALERAFYLVLLAAAATSVTAIICMASNVFQGGV